ncbi:MAG TPA: hypothetical protein VHZ32_05670 [Rhizomicrobium sp.]|nr:hypothetical protein [Rhizomicrobium sp.]
MARQAVTIHAIDFIGFFPRLAALLLGMNCRRENLDGKTGTPACLPFGAMRMAGKMSAARERDAEGCGQKQKDRRKRRPFPECLLIQPTGV